MAILKCKKNVNGKIVSIQRKLILSSILSITGLLILLLIINSSIKKLELLENSVHKLEQINRNILELRIDEKNFLTKKDTLYEYKHDRISQTLQKNIALLNSTLEKSDINFSFELQKVQKHLQTYGKLFKEIVKQQKKIGLDETKGLYGSLNESVQKVQAIINKEIDEELSGRLFHIRKDEKNFMLRKKLEYVEDFKTKIDNLIKYQILFGDMEIYLKKYKRDFLKLVENEIIIGLNDNTGFKGKMNNSIKLNEQLLEEINKKLELTLSKKTEQIKLKTFLMIFIILFITIISTFILLFSIKKPLRELDRSRKQMQRYISLVDQNIISSSTDLEGNITYASQAFCNVSGFTKEELIGKNHRIIKHKDMPDEIFKDMWDTIKSGNTWKGEIKNRKKDGGFYWVNASISPIFEDGNIVGYTGIRQNITDKKIIEEISITDGLTGIFNRRHFNELFPKIINGAKRDNVLFCFLIMDIDHFKQYNDTYGHQMGDDVLKKVANTLKGTLKRAEDYCFRLGGEEFGVIFKVSEKSEALKFAELIRKNIEGLKIEHSGNSASSYITASLGLACKNAADIPNDDAIYKEGDDLLYLAKRNGRNRICSNI